MYSIQELRTSTLKELHLELQHARRELLRVRIGLKTKHLKDSSLAPKAQVYIAQILTIMKQAERDPKAAGHPVKEEPKEIGDERRVTSDEKKAKKELKSKKVVKKVTPKKKA